MLIKKAIILATGTGEQFYPLTKVLPKEVLPLADLPLVDYLVREIKDSDINEIVFVLEEGKKMIADYFKKGKEMKEVSLRFCFQQHSKGDGGAILKARNYIKKNNFAVLSPKHIFEGKSPVLGQLEKIFQTSQQPVIGLKRVSPEKKLFYDIVRVEKIANKLYKIKEIGLGTKANEPLSDLAIAGRFILTPDVFDYLGKTKVNKKGEKKLVDALNLMLKNGKVVYGYEFSGEWLECGQMIDWLKSNLYLSLKHPKYGPMLKDFLKKNL